ncbi:MAG: glycosyltransferase [bacterium]|nr:glycosyltransferase [bacterium]
MTDKNKKTILFTLPDLYGGGAQKVIINIIRNLDREKYNIKLLLINPVGDFLDLVPEHVKMVDLGIKRTRYALFGIIRALKRKKPDIVFSTLNRMNILILFASLFIRHNMKIIVREPNMPGFQIKNKTIPGWYHTCIRWLYPRAYMVVAQTDEMKDEIIQYYKIKPEKIEVIFNPLDVYYIAESVKGQKNPYENSAINIVASGRLSHQKGFDILIEAFNIVLKKSKNSRKYKLSILGRETDYKYKEFLVKLVKKLGIEKDVDFLGFQKNPYTWYKYADIFVLSSRWEGFPNVLLEALFLKTPVIAVQSVPVIGRLIDDGGNGYLVENGNIDALAQKMLDYNKSRNKTFIFSEKVNFCEFLDRL